MGNGGFLMGLGQGLQGFGNAMAQVPLQQQEARRQAMMMALQQQQVDQTKSYQDAQLAIQGEAQKRLAQQMAQEQARYVGGNLPANTPLSPEMRQSQETGGMGAFVRPDMGFAPGQIPVTEGMGRGPAPDVDTGRGYSIPTEDSKARTAILGNQSRADLQGSRLANQVAIQKMRGEAAMEVEKLRQMDPVRNRQVAIALQNAQTRLQELDLAWQREMRGAEFQANVTEPNILHDNSLADFLANNPVTQTGGEEILGPSGKPTGQVKPLVAKRPSVFIPPPTTRK